MSLKMLFLTLACAAVLTAGDPLLSLDPVVTEQEAIFDPGLIGIWTIGNGKDLLIIRQNGDHAYRITLAPDSGALTFEARLFQVGETRLLDVLFPADALRIPAHILVRVWLEGTSLRTGFLESNWLPEEAARQLWGRPTRSGWLLTAPGTAIRAFLMKHEPDEEHYSDVTTFQKLGYQADSGSSIG